uniref:Uncharacterized protein n=1 Tax=Neobodo designis TaxID=312471 RepID=A0A7S1QSM8_NEODS|mmetsp:Transcript_51370/g.158343  ORF Transcript_51370/g.158343 Transcript_51370/m.158343 type:complete len:137 (+) Transcript_51370:138-548(+)
MRPMGEPGVGGDRHADGSFAEVDAHSEAAEAAAVGVCAISHLPRSLRLCRTRRNQRTGSTPRHRGRGPCRHHFQLVERVPHGAPVYGRTGVTIVGEITVALSARRRAAIAAEASVVRTPRAPPPDSNDDAEFNRLR